MMFSKIFTVLVVLTFAVAPMVMGQDASSDASASGRQNVSRARPAEETVDQMIIRETSSSTSRDQNLLALGFIEDAVGSGNTGEEIYTALERLILAGHFNRVSVRGNVVNFPDVRQGAAKQLGALGTVEARDILLRACRSEFDTIVLQEIMNSLAAIETDDNARTIAVIVEVAGRIHRLPPQDNHVALAAVNALEAISGRSGGLTDSFAFQYLFDIARGPYVPTVRDRAWEVINGLRGSGS